MVGSKLAGIRKPGTKIVTRKNAWTLETKNTDELAQRKGNTLPKYTRRGILMRDRCKQPRRVRTVTDVRHRRKGREAID